MGKSKEKPAEKEFSLKQTEVQMIANMNKRANAAMFDFLCYVAIERLAYNPVQGTQFRVENGKLYISEIEVKDEPKEEVAVS